MFQELFENIAKLMEPGGIEIPCAAAATGPAEES